MEKDEIREEETLEQEPQEEVVEEETQDEVVEEVEESEEDSTDWQAEALKWKSIAKRNNKPKPVNSNINSKLETKAENPDDEVVDRLSHLELAEKKRQFGYENGLSPQETDKVFQVSPNPTAETLKDPFLKAGLEAVRRQERVANNTPSTSAKSPSFNVKKMKEATPEEKQEAFTKYMKAKNQ
jgi:hypothetical protein